MANNRRVLRGVEGLEKKQMLAADLLGAMPVEPTEGGSYESGDWFVADSFSFGVEREMKESGEKGGTADINIGVGELQECSISKSMDWASPLLAQYANNDNSPGQSIDIKKNTDTKVISPGTAEINFVEVAGGGDAAGEQDDSSDSGDCTTGFKELGTDGLVGPETLSTLATDEALAETTPICYLKYKLDRCFVKSWSTSGDADDRPTEEVAFYYNKVQ